MTATANEDDDRDLTAETILKNHETSVQTLLEYDYLRQRYETTVLPIRLPKYIRREIPDDWTEQQRTCFRIAAYRYALDVLTIEQLYRTFHRRIRRIRHTEGSVESVDDSVTFNDLMSFSVTAFHRVRSHKLLLRRDCKMLTATPDDEQVKRLIERYNATPVEQERRLADRGIFAHGLVWLDDRTLLLLSGNENYDDAIENIENNDVRSFRFYDTLKHRPILRTELPSYKDFLKYTDSGLSGNSGNSDYNTSAEEYAPNYESRDEFLRNDELRRETPRVVLSRAIMPRDIETARYVLMLYKKLFGKRNVERK